MDWLTGLFPDAPPWVPLAALIMCLALLVFILAALFPSVTETLFFQDREDRGRHRPGRSELRAAGAAGGVDPESPAGASSEGSASTSVDLAALQARLGSEVDR